LLELKPGQLEPLVEHLDEDTHFGIGRVDLHGHPQHSRHRNLTVGPDVMGPAESATD
jgi:hypothetical protein